MTFSAQLEYRAKALAAAVAGAVVAYVATAVQSGDPLTLRGAVAAAVGAVVSGLGVHQAPRNAPQPRKRRAPQKKV